MKIYRIIELTDGNVTKLHNVFYLTVGALNEAIDRLVLSYCEQGMNISETLRHSITKKFYLEGEGFAEIKVMDRLYSMNRFSGKMYRLTIGVLEYDAE